MTLNFGSPSPGSLNDVNGQGTGFTHRIPGSGSAIPSNDPNLTLDSANSQLRVRSTRSDFNTTGFGRNLSGMEAPALLLNSISTADFLVQAHFLDLRVDQPSDQIGIFVGSSVDNVVRGGVHEGPVAYQSFFGYSQNGADGPPSGGSVNQFQAGQEGIFEIGRLGGIWQFRWQNLSAPGFNGSVENVMLPGLDSQSSLYVGVFNHDARNTIAQTAILDWFTVQIIPEPVSAVLVGSGAAFLLLIARRRSSRI
jgi:hypothetical protein